MSVDSPSPLPQDVLRRLTGTTADSALSAFDTIAGEPREIEGFRPLSDCLEWRLADAYWRQAGVIPFVRNDVPYLVNNTGRLSENAAALTLSALSEADLPPGVPLTLLEIGAGTGLHARYFLDAFAAQCRAAGCNFYDRLIYVVSDRFERTVLSWEENGVFAEHRDRVALRVCEAEEPARLFLPGGGEARLPTAPFAVFCNYLLDVLPAKVARCAPDGLEELCVRTHLAGGTDVLRAAGIGSLEEARTLAASGGRSDLERLLPLWAQLDLETAFRPWTPQEGVEQELAAAMTGTDRTIINARALTCLDRVMGLVHASGFVLINDYGPVRAEDVAGHLGVQRFGGSVALGLNFPLLETALASRGLSVLAPEGDDSRRVHTRLIARRAAERTKETLRARFRLEADRHLDAPLEEARRHVAAGRTDEAVAAYRLVIERNPHDWQMLGEAAEYVGLQLRDFSAGLALVRAALTRNPWCSAWLWNVLGDCLFYKDRLDDAHAAFLEAQRIDPDDPRTNLNLAYTLFALGAPAEALAAIARGLAQDGRGRGAYRVRLLEKQSQILASLSERASLEQERLVKRAQRFR